MDELVKTAEKTRDVKASSSKPKENYFRYKHPKKSKAKCILKLSFYNRSYIILRNLTIVYMAWGSTMMTYFGLVRISVTLEGNIYANFFLIASAEAVAVLISLCLIGRLGRKFLIVSFLTISALCLFCAVTQMDNEYTVVVLSITGNSFINFSISMVFAIFFF